VSATGSIASFHSGFIAVFRLRGSSPVLRKVGSRADHRGRGGPNKVVGLCLSMNIFLKERVHASFRRPYPRLSCRWRLFPWGRQLCMYMEQFARNTTIFFAGRSCWQFHYFPTTGSRWTWVTLANQLGDCESVDILSRTWAEGSGGSRGSESIGRVMQDAPMSETLRLTFTFGPARQYI
jgi:hypothetical protein